MTPKRAGTQLDVRSGAGSFILLRQKREESIIQFVRAGKSEYGERKISTAVMREGYVSEESKVLVI